MEIRKKKQRKEKTNRNKTANDRLKPNLLTVIISISDLNIPIKG